MNIHKVASITLCLLSARMIESEFKADPQYKSNSDKVDSKSDKKGKVKGTAGLVQGESMLQNLEKAWSQTANEKAYAKDPPGYHCLHWAFTTKQYTTNLLLLLLTKGTPILKAITTSQGEGGPGGVVEGVEAEVTTKIDLQYAGGARAMLIKRKPSIEYKIVPFIKNARRIGGRHTLPVLKKTPVLLVIQSR